jgi:hypothetical protein
MVDPTMGGEDFSEYSLPDHSIPAIDFHVGAVAPDKMAASKKPGAPPLPSLHSSKFAPVPEPTIKTGLIAMTSAVLDLMKSRVGHQLPGPIIGAPKARGWIAEARRRSRAKSVRVAEHACSFHVSPVCRQTMENFITPQSCFPFSS